MIKITMSISDKQDNNGSEKLIRKILPNKQLEIYIYSNKFQLVHIRVANLVGAIKLSCWQEIQKGQNILTMDANLLLRGTYKILIDFPEENSREELFTIC